MAITAAPLSAQTGGKPIDLPGIHLDGYLMFRSADSAFMYWLDSRLQIDAATYTGNTEPSRRAAAKSGGRVSAAR